MLNGHVYKSSSTTKMHKNYFNFFLYFMFFYSFYFLMPTFYFALSLSLSFLISSHRHIVSSFFLNNWSFFSLLFNEITKKPFSLRRKVFLRLKTLKAFLRVCYTCIPDQLIHIHFHIRKTNKFSSDILQCWC